MRRLIIWLKKLPNYVAAFGLRDGIRLLLRIERKLPVKSTRRGSVTVPGYRAPVHLRRSVADHSAFWICLVAQQYSVAAFPQKARLDAAYQSMRHADRRPLIIDAGANIGMSALWFARAYPEAQIVAIEPDPENYSLLVLNTEAYSERIIPLQGGIWPRACGLRIENAGAGAQHFITREVPAGTDDAIRAYTAEEIMAMVGADEVLIAKIDIEGGQDSLFQDNTDWVGRTHLIVVELDDDLFPWAGTSRSFFRCVSQYPFDYLLSGENIVCFRDAEAPAMPADGTAAARLPELAAAD
jgi:FkbM family methyltransferase